MSQPPTATSIAPSEDFARFPNELVLNIAKHLGEARDGASSQALSRLGSLNHSYRDYTEEFLYEHCDATALPLTPFLLLRTSSSDLAVKVKSMAISPIHVFVSDPMWGPKVVGFVPWTTPRCLAPFLEGLALRALDLIEKSPLDRAASLDGSIN
jgi:hypothetical protein